MFWINHCEKLIFMIMAIYEFGARELWAITYFFDCRLSPVVKIRRWKEAQIEILANSLGDPLITLKQISVQDGRRQQKSEIW